MPSPVSACADGPPLTQGFLTMNAHRINPHAVVLDVDGVLLDFDRGYTALSATALGRTLVRQTLHFPLGLRYALSKAEEAAMWQSLANGGYEAFPVLPGAVEAVQRLRKAGMSLHLVTGIDPRFASARLNNLAAHGIVVDSIDCVGHGMAKKDAAIARIAPAVFVDDRLAHLHDVPFVPRRVWIDHGDEQYEHGPDGATDRVGSLLEWVLRWEDERARDAALTSEAPQAPEASRTAVRGAHR